MRSHSHWLLQAGDLDGRYAEIESTIHVWPERSMRPVSESIYAELSSYHLEREGS